MGQSAGAYALAAPFWVGLYLVFAYNPEGVVDSSGKVASEVERFYFTGYVISPLGLGNFKPITLLFDSSPVPFLYLVL